MIQPIKQFRVTRLTISGFKGYADQKTFQFGGMNVISGHKSVNDLICSIRKKMGLSPKDTDYIKTVKGVGYCFAP